jgi:branched-chain amino acid transport system substrate-binding protein
VNYRRRMMSGLAVIALVALAGCAADDESEDGAAPNTDPETCENGPGVTDTSIKFGGSMPLSGASATLGQEQLDAQEAFIEMVNADGGINGRKLELVVQDSVNDPQKDVTNIQYLIEQEEVFAIWGSFGSANAVAVAPITDAAGMPYLFPYANSTPLTTPVTPYTFSIATTNLLQTKAIGNYMAENEPFKDRKLAVMTIASPDGVETTQGFKDSAMGDNIVADMNYERGSVSFKAQLLTAKEAGAGIMYAGVTDAQFAKLLSEANELGMTPGEDVIFIPAAGGVSTKVFELAPGLVDGNWGGVFFDSPTSDEPGMTELRETVTEYKADASIGTAAIISWVGGLVVREALENAGDCVNAEVLAAEIEKLEDFDTGGLTAPLNFSEDDHLGNQSVQLVEAQDGEWVKVGDWIQG